MTAGGDRRSEKFRAAPPQPTVAVIFRIPETDRAEIDRWRRNNGKRSMSAAVRELVRAALSREARP